MLVGRVVAGLRGAERRDLERLGAEWTWTSRKRRPMMKARRNSGFTCSGVASVAMSKSLGSMPSSRSRTAPPTMNALKPASCSLRVTSSAPRDSWSRRIGWSRGRRRAVARGLLARQQAGDQAADHRAAGGAVRDGADVGGRRRGGGAGRRAAAVGVSDGAMIARGPRPAATRPARGPAIVQGRPPGGSAAASAGRRRPSSAAPAGCGPRQHQFEPRGGDRLAHADRRVARPQARRRRRSRAPGGRASDVAEIDAGPQRRELRRPSGCPRPGPSTSWAACAAGRRSVPAARRRRSARPAPRCRGPAGRPGRTGDVESRPASACPSRPPKTGRARRTAC